MPWVELQNSSLPWWTNTNISHQFFIPHFLTWLSMAYIDWGQPTIWVEVALKHSDLWKCPPTPSSNLSIYGLGKVQHSASSQARLDLHSPLDSAETLPSLQLVSQWVKGRWRAYQALRTWTLISRISFKISDEPPFVDYLCNHNIPVSRVIGFHSSFYTEFCTFTENTQISCPLLLIKFNLPSSKTACSYWPILQRQNHNSCQQIYVGRWGWWGKDDSNPWMQVADSCFHPKLL